MKPNSRVWSGGFALGLLAVGLAICLFDLYTSHRYGFHLNEVASIAEDGSPIDWPTGERPLFTLVPLFVYRVYEERDFESCLIMYRKNEAGRFPQGHGAKFVEYLLENLSLLCIGSRTIPAH